MFRHIRLLAAAFVITTIPLEGQPRDKFLDPNANASEAAKAFQPQLYCTKYGDDWEVFLQFNPLTNYERFSWMLTANQFGGQLQVCLTNGVPCQTTNAEVLEAFSLPFFTTVSNALKGVEWRRRGAQWPWSNSAFQTAGFRLKSAFNLPFTNDVFFQLTPLMYKVNTNNQSAWLVSFPPLRLKLKADGNVEKLE
jgi:hypothetical protein